MNNNCAFVSASSPIVSNPSDHKGRKSCAPDDQDQAFELLEKAYQVRDTRPIHLKVDPMLDGLRSDPRYANLLARMNLAS